MKERQVSRFSPQGRTHSNSDKVVELGAGAALPSLLLSTLQKPPKLVVVTDHPDEVIFNNLQSSVMRNQKVVDRKCHIVARGYDWGTNPSSLLCALFCDISDFT